MTIWIDADEHLTTWKYISEAGGFKLYKGNAERGDIIIRWGANHGKYDYPHGTKILNPKLILSKAIQNKRFIRHHIPTPVVFNSETEWIRAGRPKVVRKPFQGQMGTGMTLTNNPRFTDGFLIQEYIDKDREFRAMMVNNILAFFMEKHQTNGDFRWNEHRGARWTGVPADNELRRMIKQIGHKTLLALDYDFGAIDIIMKGRNLYILEVNSRPEFGGNNVQRFVNAMVTYIDI